MSEVSVKAALTRRRKEAEAAFVPLWKRLLTYALYFAFLLVFGAARVGAISPFAAGFYFALASIDPHPIVLLPLYVLASLVRGADAATAVAELITAVCVTVARIVAGRRKRGGLAVLLAVAAVGRSAHLVMLVRGGDSVLSAGLELIFSLLFAYLSACALAPVVGGLKRKLSDTEIACLWTVMIALGAGLGAVEPYGVKLLYVVAMLAISAAALFTGKGGAIAVGLSLGVGGAAAAYGPMPAAMLAFVAAAYAVLSKAPRLVSLTGALLAAALFELYFGLDPAGIPFDLLALAAGGLLYVILPSNKLDVIAKKYFSPPDRSAVRALISTARRETAAEVERVSEVFGDMSRALRAGMRPAELSPAAVCAKIYSAVCAGCRECDSRRESSAAALMKLSELTVENGSTGVTDVPFFIENDCPNAARIMSVANEYGHMMLRRAREAGKDNSLREELAAQLDGVRAVLARAAENAARSPGFDPETEDLLTEELNYRGANVADALVTADGRATVVVRENGPDGETIAKVADGVLKTRYRAIVEPSLYTGYSVVSLKKMTEYDAVFATSALSKSREATGDAHSFMRIGESKFMLALCDGMGFGANASRISETAIGLVESFYRAGFDSDFTLRLVNRFLSRDSDESFAAFDILVCDLDTLERTIIKLGSPASYVLGGAGVTRLEGSALPLGAVGELTPSVTADKAAEGDTVIFTSDGVGDLFEGDELAHFIGSLPPLSVRELCERVTAEARSRSGGEIRDDMTVVAARVFKRV